MVKKIVSFSLTDALIDYLNKEAEESGLSKSDIIRRAIEYYASRNQ